MANARSTIPSAAADVTVTVRVLGNSLALLEPSFGCPSLHDHPIFHQDQWAYPPVDVGKEGELVYPATVGSVERGYCELLGKWCRARMAWFRRYEPYLPTKRPFSETT